MAQRVRTILRARRQGCLRWEPARATTDVWPRAHVANLIAMAESDGKWLSGVSPFDSLSAAARAGLMRQLHSVYAMAPLAMHFGLEHTEYVHRLRVATRRSHVALRAFRRVLSSKRRKRWVDRLRTIRRHAGPARDLDVFVNRWSSLADLDSKARQLIKFLHVRRVRSQRNLLDGLMQQPWRHYPRELEALIRHVRWRGRGTEPNWGAAALESLQQPMAEFLQAGRRLSAEPQGSDDIARLHAFRIQGKRVRYQFELCSAAFAAEPHHRLHRRLTSIQQRLGQINDHAVGIRNMKEWMRKHAFTKWRSTLARWIEMDRAALHLEIGRLGMQLTSDEWERIERDWLECLPSPERYSSSMIKQI